MQRVIWRDLLSVFKDRKAFISHVIFIEIMVDEGFNKLTIVGIVAGSVLIVIGAAVWFLEELLSDILNVEGIRFFSIPLIIFGVVLVVAFFLVLLLWDRFR